MKLMAIKEYTKYIILNIIIYLIIGFLIYNLINYTLINNFSNLNNSEYYLKDIYCGSCDSKISFYNINQYCPNCGEDLMESYTYSYSHKKLYIKDVSSNMQDYNSNNKKYNTISNITAFILIAYIIIGVLVAIEIEYKIIKPYKNRIKNKLL